VRSFGGIHEAIAAYIEGAEHLDEVRLRLRSVFERFIAEDDGETVALVPHLRPEAIDAVMADISGAKREALRVTTQHDGLLIE
jgi:broad specificity phosphatase PhoE